MGKIQKYYICTQCSHRSLNWIGRCPSCEAWNVFELETNDKVEPILKIRSTSEFCEKETLKRRKTGLAEFDRVIGKGLVAGGVYLLTGDPGVGKSTILLQLLQSFNLYNEDEVLLYQSGEETIDQLGLRSNKLGISSDSILLTSEPVVEKLKKYIEKRKPAITVIDSIQTMVSEELNSVPGGINQIKQACMCLVELAKKLEVIIIIVGQITKEGVAAGPKHLEHMVDCVLSFHNSNEVDLKILRIKKNRFGPINEIGLFKMTNGKFIENQYLLSKTHNDQSKTGVSFGGDLNGERLFPCEVQVLINENCHPSTKRVSIGFDGNQLVQKLAILEKYLGLSFFNCDVFLSVTQGSYGKNNILSLACIVSILSSYLKIEIPQNILFLGEVNLDGEISKVALSESHLAQIKGHGFKKTFCGKEIKNVLKLKELILNKSFQ